MFKLTAVGGASPVCHNGVVVGTPHAEGVHRLCLVIAGARSYFSTKNEEVKDGREG